MRVVSKLILTVIFGGLLLGLGSLLLFPAFSNLTLFLEPGTLSAPIQLRALAYPSRFYDAQGKMLAKKKFQAAPRHQSLARSHRVPLRKNLRNR